MENCRKLTDQTLNKLHSLPLLTSFDVGGNFNMTVEGLRILIDTHENTSMFARVHISGHDIDDSFLELIGQRCRKLQSLSIGYSKVTDAGVLSLLENRKLITRLHVHWCELLT
jgi:hypothetical protein